MIAWSHERRQSYGRALLAAVFDRELQIQGRKFVYFCDADLVAGALFAKQEYEKEQEYDSSLARHSVRALWVDEALVPMRLTLPHLLEIRNLLEQVNKQGGVDRFLRRRSSWIDENFGLRVSDHRLQRLMDLVAHRAPQDNLEQIIHSFTPTAFAYLEAHIASKILRESGGIADRLELDVYLGEPMEYVQQDPRFDELVHELSRIRNKLPKSRSLSAPPNRLEIPEPKSMNSDHRDVCAVLTITRMVEESLNKARLRDGAVPDVEFRFYTQTTPLRVLCNYTGSQRTLLSRIRDPHAEGTICQDNTETCLRGSTYYILRSSFPSLGFSDPNGSDLNDVMNDLQFFRRLAEFMIIEPDVPQNLSYIDNVWRKYALQHNTHDEIDSQAQSMQQWFFFSSLMNRKSRFVKNLMGLSENKGLQEIGRLIHDPPETVVNTVRMNIKRDIESIAATIRQAQFHADVMGSFCYIDPWPPDDDTIQDALGRWSGLLDSEAMEWVHQHLEKMLADHRPNELGRDGSKRVKEFVSSVITRAGSKSQEGRNAAYILILTLVGRLPDHIYTSTDDMSGESSSVRDRFARAIINVWRYSDVDRFSLKRLRDAWEQLIELTDTSLAADGDSSDFDFDQIAVCILWVGVYSLEALRVYSGQWDVSDLPDMIDEFACNRIGYMIDHIDKSDVRYKQGLTARVLLWSTMNLIKYPEFKGCGGKHSEESSYTLRSDLDILRGFERNTYIVDAVRWGQFSLWRLFPADSDEFSHIDIPWPVLERYQYSHRQEVVDECSPLGDVD